MQVSILVRPRIKSVFNFLRDNDIGLPLRILSREVQEPEKLLVTLGKQFAAINVASFLTLWGTSEISRLENVIELSDGLTREPLEVSNILILMKLRELVAYIKR